MWSWIRRMWRKGLGGAVHEQLRNLADEELIDEFRRCGSIFAEYCAIPDLPAAATALANIDALLDEYNRRRPACPSLSS